MKNHERRSIPSHPSLRLRSLTWQTVLSPAPSMLLVFRFLLETFKLKKACSIPRICSGIPRLFVLILETVNCDDGEGSCCRELPAADRVKSSLDSIVPSEEEDLERRGSRGPRLSDLLQIQVRNYVTRSRMRRLGYRVVCQCPPRTRSKLSVII